MGPAKLEAPGRGWVGCTNCAMFLVVLLLFSEQLNKKWGEIIGQIVIWFLS